MPELRHDVGGHVVDDNVDRAFTKFEAAHRVVGDDLQHDPVVLWRTFIVLGERRQHDAIVGREAGELVGPGADRHARGADA